MVLTDENTAEIIRLLKLSVERSAELKNLSMVEQQNNFGLDWDIAQIEYPVTKALAILEDR